MRAIEAWNAARVVWKILGPAMIFAGLLAGQVEGSFELPAEFARYRFPLRKAGDCTLPLPKLAQRPKPSEPAPVRVEEIVVRQTADASLRVEGIDSGGAPWQLDVKNQQAGCSIWHGDLDRNGREDVIIVTSDSTSGPGVEVTLLMMDAKGRPAPWQAFGYFDGNHQEGLHNLVDLDGDGRAELLFLHVEGERLDDGCTSLALYRTENARWRRLDGRFARFEFPIRNPKGAMPSEEPDLTTAIAETASPVRIRARIPGDPKACGVSATLGTENSAITLVDQGGRAACGDGLILSDGTRTAVPYFVVIDRLDGRSLGSFSTRALIDEIVDRQLPVRLAGHRCDSGCAPILLWASEVQ